MSGKESAIGESENERRRRSARDTEKEGDERELKGVRRETGLVVGGSCLMTHSMHDPHLLLRKHLFKIFSSELLDNREEMYPRYYLHRQ